MSSLEIFCPASVHEAITILETSPMPVDSPTQRRYRTSTHLSTTFASGRRKPEWVWAARAADGTVVGHVAALSPLGQAPELLQHFGLPADSEQARELMVRATGAARSLGVSQAGIFALPVPPLTTWLCSHWLARCAKPDGSYLSHFRESAPIGGFDVWWLFPPIPALATPAVGWFRGSNLAKVKRYHNKGKRQ